MVLAYWVSNDKIEVSLRLLIGQANIEHPVI